MPTNSTKQTDAVVEAREWLSHITQGEWISDMDSNAVKTVHGQWIAQMWSKDEADFENAFRNREFIARAPELLKTLAGELEEWRTGKRRIRGHQWTGNEP